MNTAGRKRWPPWLRKAIEERKNVEIKEHAGKYYAYSINLVKALRFQNFAY